MLQLKQLNGLNISFVFALLVQTYLLSSGDNVDNDTVITLRHWVQVAYRIHVFNQELYGGAEAVVYHMRILMVSHFHSFLMVLSIISFSPFTSVVCPSVLLNIRFL